MAKTGQHFSAPLDDGSAASQASGLLSSHARIAFDSNGNNPQRLKDAAIIVRATASEPLIIVRNTVEHKDPRTAPKWGSAQVPLNHRRFVVGWSTVATTYFRLGQVKTWSLLGANRFSPTIFIGLGAPAPDCQHGYQASCVAIPTGSLPRLDSCGMHRYQQSGSGRQKNVPESNRFLVSSFDRRSYVQRKRGKQEAARRQDGHTMGHPNYQFAMRRARARAGQFASKADSASTTISRGSRRNCACVQAHPIARRGPIIHFVTTKDRVVNVLIYASVAGGTGSGGFLPIAYLIQGLDSRSRLGTSQCRWHAATPSGLYG